MMVNVEESNVWTRSPIVYSFVDYETKDIEEHFDFSRVAFFNIPVSLNVEEEELREMRSLYEEQVRLGIISNPQKNKQYPTDDFSHFMGDDNINKNILQFNGFLNQLLIKKDK